MALVLWPTNSSFNPALDWLPSIESHKLNFANCYSQDAYNYSWCFLSTYGYLLGHASKNHSDLMSNDLSTQWALQTLILNLTDVFSKHIQHSILSILLMSQQRPTFLCKDQNP